MADLVMKLAQRILALPDVQRRALLQAVLALRPLPPLTPAEKQRRYRERRPLGLVTRRRGYALPVVTSEALPVVTENALPPVTENRYRASRKNVTVGNGIPLEPPVVSFKEVPAFESFWTVYPKRVGKGKALEVWNKNGCNNHAEVILTAVQAQMDYLLRDGGQFIPLPATWLNQKRWQDDPPLPSLLSQKTAGNLANLHTFVEGMNREEN